MRFPERTTCATSSLLLQQGRKITDCKRAGEEVPLPLITPLFTQPLQRLMGLNPFGNDAHIKTLAECNDGVCDTLVALDLKNILGK